MSPDEDPTRARANPYREYRGEDGETRRYILSVDCGIAQDIDAARTVRVEAIALGPDPDLGAIARDAAIALHDIARRFGALTVARGARLSLSETVREVPR